MDLSLEQLREAVRIREEIDSLEARLASLLAPSDASSRTASTASPSGGRKRSAASRKRMAEAQRARWAKAKSGVNTADGPQSSGRKRRLSPEARARIAASARRRWAAAKRAGRSRL